VFWGKSVNGARVILDRRPLQVQVLRAGADGKPDGTGRVEYRKAFQSHFASCPNANQHRSKP